MTIIFTKTVGNNNAGGLYRVFYTVMYLFFLITWFLFKWRTFTLAALKKSCYGGNYSGITKCRKTANFSIDWRLPQLSDFYKVRFLLKTDFV